MKNIVKTELWKAIHNRMFLVSLMIGIKLAHESECSLILPFSLFEKYFSGATWNKIDNYELFLELTIYPAQKKVKVQ